MQGLPAPKRRDTTTTGWAAVLLPGPVRRTGVQAVTAPSPDPVDRRVFDTVTHPMLAPVLAAREMTRVDLRDEIRAAIRSEASHGAYQMPGEAAPYEAFAAKLTDAVMAMLERRAIEGIGADGLRRDRAVVLPRVAGFGGAS